MADRPPFRPVSRKRRVFQGDQGVEVAQCRRTDGDRSDRLPFVGLGAHAVVQG